MRILFSTGALYGFPYVLPMRLAVAAGCDGVELVLDPWTIAAGAKRVLRASRAVGAPIVALHPSLFAIPGWKRDPQMLGRLGQFALETACELIVLHPPRPVGAGDHEARFDRGLDAMRQVVRDDVEITIENIAVFEPGDITHDYVWPEKVARFAAQRGLRMTLDTTHLASTGTPVVEGYERIAGAVRHVHLSNYRRPPARLDRPDLDTYFKHHQLPSEGEIDVSLFIQRLRHHCYSGSLTLELSPVVLQLWQPGMPRRLLSDAVEYVRAAATCEVPDAAPVPAQPVAEMGLV